MCNPKTKPLRWKRWLVLLPIAATCAISGCSGHAAVEDDDEAPADEAPGVVDGATTVGSLSRAEAEVICEASVERLEDSVLYGMCIRDAAEQAQSLGHCELLAGSCKVEWDIVTGLCVEDLLGVDCDATVELLEQCAEDTYRPFEALAEGGCEAYFEDPSLAQDTPESCEKLAEQCPDLYSGQGDGEADEPRGPAILGEIDGEPVSVGAGESSSGAMAANGEAGWSARAAFDAASLYLWHDGDVTRGLAELPHPAQAATQWICLADVETDPGVGESGMPGSWISSNLSRLNRCSLDDAEPLTLSFGLDGIVQGSFAGEAIDWVSAGIGATPRGLELFFETQSGQQLTLSLDLGGDTLGDAPVLDVQSAALIEIGAEGAAACGGSGVLDDGPEALTVSIEQFSTLQNCPGESVEGELGGPLGE